MLIKKNYDYNSKKMSIHSEDGIFAIAPNARTSEDMNIFRNKYGKKDDR